MWARTATRSAKGRDPVVLSVLLLFPNIANILDNKPNSTIQMKDDIMMNDQLMISTSLSISSEKSKHKHLHHLHHRYEFFYNTSTANSVFNNKEIIKCIIFPILIGNSSTRKFFDIF